MGKPEIRFKGYTDEWEQRKLGDVLERRIEQRQQSEEYPRLAFASWTGSNFRLVNEKQIIENS
ncbi:MAG: hypothetical protein ACLRP0_01755 [Blautia wexlerae]